MLYSAQLPWPVDWTAVFHREAPLLVEIGFGGGDFLRHLAQKRPNCNLLGVEIAQPSLRKAAKRLAGLPHVRVMYGEAIYTLWLLCAPESVHGLYLNFPDPWPKHHYRRLINGRFLHLAATRLAPEATLYLATDIADYAEAMSACLADSPYFTNCHATPFVTGDRERPITKYERLAMENGRTCHYFHWQRNLAPAPNPFNILSENSAFTIHHSPFSGESPMPHVIFHSPLSLDEIGDRFVPFHADAEGIHIRFLEIFQSRYDNKLFVETFIKEEPLEQRIGIAIELRPSGDHLINLREIGFPRPTPGVRLAIYHLAEWVKGLHPKTEIIRHNLFLENDKEVHQ